MISVLMIAIDVWVVELDFGLIDVGNWDFRVRFATSHKGCVAVRMYLKGLGLDWACVAAESLLHTKTRSSREHRVTVWHFLVSRHKCPESCFRLFRSRNELLRHREVRDSLGC